MGAAGWASAQSVTLDEASRVASLFFEEKNMSFRKCAEVGVSGPDTLYYIMNADDAFVVVAGNKNCVPVLAYVLDHSYRGENLIPPVEMWLKHYHNQLSLLTEQPVENPVMEEYWAALLGTNASYRTAQSITPFLASKWGQDDFYNFYCPRDLDGPNGRAVTGCVATAMAQILYYFRFPESGMGEYHYTHPVYGSLSADFEEATYNYEAMCDQPLHVNPAASLLNAHLGIAVDMEYGPAASGMTNHKAAYVMRTYFKYSPETEYVYRDSVSLDWDSLIVDHLERRIPLYYAGWSVPHTDGHAFVCDGFEKNSESQYYYHFNFGWSGYYDGYFYTRSLNPGGSNFNLAQELVVNAYPDTARYTYPPILMSGNETLTSGAGSFEYDTPNAGHVPVDYSWFIIPDIDHLDSIRFSVSYKIGENDTLMILSDDPYWQGYTITNDSAVISGFANGSEISFRFKSETGTDSRFRVNYHSQYRIFCRNTELYTQPSGTIEDGSGEFKYNNCAYCKAYIRTADQQITLRMEEFDTELNEDILYIYDARQRPPALLASLSGNLTDSVYTFSTNRLNLIFETSEKNTYDGWRLHYTSGGITAINEFEWDIDISVLPNPVQDYVDIRLREENPGLHKNRYRYEIYDLSGRKLTGNGIDNTLTRVDMSRYSAGIYFLSISHPEQSGRVLKVIKK